MGENGEQGRAHNNSSSLAGAGKMAASFTEVDKTEEKAKGSESRIPFWFAYI